MSELKAPVTTIAGDGDFAVLGDGRTASAEIPTWNHDLYIHPACANFVVPLMMQDSWKKPNGTEFLISFWNWGIQLNNCPQLEDSVVGRKKKNDRQHSNGEKLKW